MSIFEAMKEKPDYRKREQAYQGQALKLKQAIRFNGGFRLMLFVVLIGSIYAAVTGNPVYYWVALVAGLAFLLLVKRGFSLTQKFELTTSLKELNFEEQQSLQGDWSFRESGTDFSSPTHDYAYDLDIFGPRSIYQWLHRPMSQFGEYELSNLLSKTMLSRNIVEVRQTAVCSLANELDFRQYQQAMARINQNNSSGFMKWLSLSDSLPKLWNKYTLAIPALVAWLGVVLYSLDLIGGGLFTISILIPLGITGTRVKETQFTAQLIATSGSELSYMLKVFGAFQKIEDSSEWVGRMKRTTGGGNGAIAALNRFKRYLDALDNRNNLIMGILLNAFLLWDLQLLWRLEGWRKRYSDDVKQWFNVLGEVEAFASLATMSVNYPDFIFPKLTNGPGVQMDEGIHPFLAHGNGVANSIAVSKTGDFTIVTGANMAGKSTFLRSIGVNLILASAGGPVSAQSFSWTPVRLISSMRTADSLQDDASYFFAELNGLKHIIDALDAGEILFVLLDEILKGTNSVDKANGSKAFLRKITKKEAMGVIATHDLSLCELETELPNHISNAHFEVTFKGDELEFDYSLRQGVCQNMNASFLMKKMGIIDGDI